MEASPNLSFLLFILRFLTLGIGIIDLVLTGHSFSSDQGDEVIFFITVIFCFIFSLILLCGYLTEILKGTLRIKYIDVWFHFGGGLTLLISGIFMMAAAMDRNLPEINYTVERTISALFGIQNALIYGVIGILLFKTVPALPSKYGEGLEWEDPLIETVEAKKVDFGSITGNG